MARLLALVIVALFARTAHADPIAWSGVRCDAADALAASIEGQRGRPLADVDGLRVVVTETEDGAALALETAAGIDHRAIRGRECAALVDAVALIVTLALEDLAPPRVEAIPMPRPVEIPAPPLWRAESLDPVGVRSTPLGARLRAGAVSETGALPGIGLGASAAVSITRAWASAEVGFEAHAARSARVDGADGGAEVGLIAGSLRGCAERGAFAVCAGAVLGRFAAEGMDVLDARRVTRRWSAAQVGARWRRPLLGSLAVTAGVDATVAIDRPRFVLDDGTLVHRPAWAGLALTLAMEVRLR